MKIKTIGEKMKILNFGSLNIDKVYKVDSVVRPGETINSLSYEEFIGGKGLNQSVALARAGADVWHAGLIGKIDGQCLEDRLKEAGVKTDLIESLDSPSGHALIQVDSKGMNCIIVEGGTNRKVDEEYIDRVLDHFDKGDILLIQNEISSLPYLVDKAYEKGLDIAFNPSPMDSYVLEVDLSKVSFFLVNEIEAEAISNKVDINDIQDEMLRLYPEAKLIMTLGSEGALYRDKDIEILVNGRDVDVVDTTGAGDTFCGYFIASIARGCSVDEAMKLANLAASISCTKAGASNSIPKVEDLEKEDYYE